MNSAQSKTRISIDEWEEQLKKISPCRLSMNKLIMNYLVVEGYKNAAQKFEKESGIKGNLSDLNLTAEIDDELIDARIEIRKFIL